MADWFKVQNDLRRDSRIKTIAGQLGYKLPVSAKIALAIGGVVSIWAHFDDQSLGDFLPGLTPELIDDVAGFAGIAAAMESVGWLTFADGGARLPRFEKHNGETAKRRAEDARRKANIRSGKQADAPPTSGGQIADALRTGSGQNPDKPQTSESEELSHSRARPQGEDQDVAIAYPTSRPPSFVLNEIRRQRLLGHGVPAEEVETCFEKFVASAEGKGQQWQNWDRGLDAYGLTWGTNARDKRKQAAPTSTGPKPPELRSVADLKAEEDRRAAGR